MILPQLATHTHAPSVPPRIFSTSSPPDFRPDYKQLGLVRSACFPHTPLMALTATATPEVRKDILSSLRMRDVCKFVVSFFRPNLTFKCVSGRG